MKRTLTLFLLAGMSFLTAFSQINGEQPSKKWEKYIEVESGLIYPEGTIKESVAIRQNISSFYVNQYSSGYVSAMSSDFLAGIRYGYYFPRYKSGVTALKV